MSIQHNNHPDQDKNIFSTVAVSVSSFVEQSFRLVVVVVTWIYIYIFNKVLQNYTQYTYMHTCAQNEYMSKTGKIWVNSVV